MPTESAHPLNHCWYLEVSEESDAEIVDAFGEAPGAWSCHEHADRSVSELTRRTSSWLSTRNADGHSFIDAPETIATIVIEVLLLSIARSRKALKGRQVRNRNGSTRRRTAYSWRMGPCNFFFLLPLYIPSHQQPQTSSTNTDWQADGWMDGWMDACRCWRWHFDPSVS